MSVAAEDHTPLAISDIAREVLAELAKARRRFAPMVSAHEGLAVLEEEVDELKVEVRDNKRLPSEHRTAMRAEAIQAAAMSIRFIFDVCDVDGPPAP